MQIAFYAPLKAPDHPVPSGDRQMARLLLQALRLAGHDVEVVSTLRTHMPCPEPVRFDHLMAAAAAERGRLAGYWTATAPPDVWLTYHNYYKAPDLLGPDLTHDFAVPYAIVEASHAARRADAWGVWHSRAQHATQAAGLHVCFTARDRAGIAGLLRPGAEVLDLPPFIDGGAWRPPASRPRRSGPVILATVAMMRPGDKLDSYRFLAEALALIPRESWRLRVIGDGAARRDVEQIFGGAANDSVTFCGALDQAAVAAELREADMLAWPGFGEAFGLAYLEAQSTGLPVVALDVAGVAAVLRPGETGLLVADHTPAGYAAALSTLIEDDDLRQQMSQRAADWVRQERSLARASRLLDQALTARVARGDQDVVD